MSLEAIENLFRRFYLFISPKSIVVVLHISRYEGTKRSINIDAILIRDISPDIIEEEQIEFAEEEIINKVNDELGHRGLEAEYEIGTEIISQVPEDESIRITHKVK